jgi:hypothetical protein
MPGGYSYWPSKRPVSDANLPLLEEQLTTTLHVLLPIGNQKG